MSNLDDNRKKINEIDKQMASLFEERMNISKDIAEYKKANGLPIYDAVREKEVLNNNAKLISNDEIKEYYIMFEQNVMDLSKAYQNRTFSGLKVGYSGVEGAFGYLASKKMYPNATLIAYPNFVSAYEACEKGETDIVILPIENNYAGDVGIVMDLVFSGSLYINQMINLDVDQYLLGVHGANIKDIKEVWSHEQALNQCQKYIDEKNLKKKEFANTAIAAKEVANKNNIHIAAIASKETAKLYNLDILDSNINTIRNNTTRFAAFSKVLNTPDAKIKMGEHFIIVFTVINEAGALAKTLNIIGSHGYNMRTLRSRPMKDLMWNYYFFVELEGNINTEDGKDMLNELQTVCDKLKLVGVYHA